MANHRCVFGDVLCVLHVCEQLPESLVLHRDQADTHEDEGGKRPKATDRSEAAILVCPFSSPKENKKKQTMISLVLVSVHVLVCIMETEGGTAGFGESLHGADERGARGWGGGPDA